MRIGKKAQVTLFVIVAIVIVSGILIFFYLDRGPIVVDSISGTPDSFIESCSRDTVQESIEKVYRNGGEINTSFGVMYQGELYNYLCYNGDNYLRCYNLHPLLEKQIEERIRVDTLDSVEDCFEFLKGDFENKGFSVEMGETVYALDLIPGSVDITLSKDLLITRGSSVQTYSNFDSRIVSPLYELVKISKTIVTSESRFCAFERNGYMIFYPDYDIKLINYDNNKIYRVIDRLSGIEFKFAVRSCAVPAGI